MIERNDYYVYQHIDPDTHLVIYIGHGRGKRAYETETTFVKRRGAYGHRSMEHSEFLQSLLKRGYLPHEWCDFPFRSLSKEEAARKESGLILLTKPKFNQAYGLKQCKFNKTDLQAIFGLREMGVSYENIAKEFNVSAMTVYRAVSGKSKNYKEIMNAE